MHIELLIADGNDDWVIILSTFLSKHKPFCTAYSRVALDTLLQADTTIGVVISSIDFPSQALSGPEIFRAYRKYHSDVPFIFLSEDTSKLDKEIKADPHVHVLTKPPDFKELISLVDSLMASD